eukprot:jgi/Picsp_1/5842/NSC_03201-R1_gcn5-related n-acetyltransferase
MLLWNRELLRHKEALRLIAEQNQLEVLNVKDGVECVEIFNESFANPGDPLTRWLCRLPNVSEEVNDERMVVVADYLHRYLCEPTLRNGVALGFRNFKGQRQHRGKLVGVMCCRVPGKPSMTKVEMIRNLLTLGVPPQYKYKKAWGDEYARRFECLGRLSEISKRHTRKYKKQYWYIQIFGIVPEWRGGGLARRFLDSVGQVADLEGVPVFLETESESNERLYQHFGYETVDKCDISSSGCTEKRDIWFMVRQPNQTAGIK